MPVVRTELVPTELGLVVASLCLSAVFSTRCSTSAKPDQKAPTWKSMNLPKFSKPSGAVGQGPL